MIANQAKIQNSANVALLELDDRAVVKTDTTSLITDIDSLDQILKFAEVMAKGKVTVPAHLVGNPSDCTAITMQAMQWRMNPFLVAQKTHLINGMLGYEDELINAVINNCAPTTTRLQIEWHGDWDSILGRVKKADKKVKSDSGEVIDTYIKDWTDEEEQGLSVKVWATIIGESKPRELTLRMSQVVTRNSQLWIEDPREQLGHLAIKRWARMHCPEVVMGVYTPEEIRARKTMGTGANSQAKTEDSKAAAETILRKSKERAAAAAAMVSMDYDPVKMASTIGSADNNKSLDTIGKTIKAMVDDPNNELQSGSEEYHALRAMFAAQKNKIEAAQISINITAAKTLSQLDNIENVVKDKAQDYKPELISELQSELINARSRISM